MQMLKVTHNAWSDGLLKELNDMRSRSQMCDLKLVLKDHSLIAHSCVLAAASPFFKTILSENENLEINLESFPSRIIIYLLDFIYSGMLLFPKDDLELLHSVASTLNVPSLLELTQGMITHCIQEEPKTEDDIIVVNETSSELIADGSVEDVSQNMTSVKMSNLPLTLNLIDMVESLQVLDGGAQSNTNSDTIQICVKHEEQTMEDDAQDMDTNQMEYAAEDDIQVQSEEVLKNEVLERTEGKPRHKKTVSSVLISIKDKPVPVDGSVPDRSAKTLPDGLCIEVSQINKSENGVFATQLFPKGALFGPYEGEILDINSFTRHGRYCWKIYKDGKPLHWLDGENESVANWMRYVQQATHPCHQNLEAFQHNGQLFFRATKDIQQYSELAVKYGNKQSSILGTANKDTNCIQEENGNGETMFKCNMCDILFTSELIYYKHMHIKHAQSLPLYVYAQTNKNSNMPCREIDSNSHESMDDTVNSTMITGGIRTRSSTKQSDTTKTKQKALLVEGEIRKSKRISLQCEICAKTFTSRGNLQKHRMIHSNERPYVCPTCGRGFVQKSNLRAHIKIHNNQRDHVCSNCGKNFCRRTELRRHEKFHSDETPYVCAVCSKGFKSAGNLKRHEMCHTSLKPYKCYVCGKEFNRVENLKTHMRKHTGEKPFQCTLCGNCFTENAHLRIHMRRHSGEKPYACSVCSKAFVDMTTLRVHSRVHEKERGLARKAT